MSSNDDLSSEKTEEQLAELRRQAQQSQSTARPSPASIPTGQPSAAAGRAPGQTPLQTIGRGTGRAPRTPANMQEIEQQMSETNVSDPLLDSDAGPDMAARLGLQQSADDGLRRSARNLNRTRNNQPMYAEDQYELEQEDQVSDDDDPNEELDISLVDEREAEQEAIFKEIKDFMDTKGMKPEEFMRRWVREDSDGYRTPKYRRRTQRIVDAFSNEGYVSTRKLRQELKGLIGQAFFGQFHTVIQDETENAAANDLHTIEQIIAVNAPSWYKLMKSLLPNQRVDRAYRAEGKFKFKDSQEMLRKRITTITSMIVHSIAVVSCSWWPKAVVLFLITSGVKRRVITVLNNMGLCSSYHTGQGLIAANADFQEQRLKELVTKHSLRLIVVYDNFNRQQKHREQVQGETNEQQNMTTSLLLLNKDIPEDGGLKPEMLRYEQDLDAKDVLLDISNDTMHKKNCVYFIEQAIFYLYEKEIKEMFQAGAQTDADTMTDVDAENSPKRPEWPNIELMSCEKSEVYALPVSPHDEVSIAGSIQVRDDIHLNFMGLDRDKDFKDVLRPIVGDNMTIKRMQSMKAQSVESEKEYDRNSWMLPNPVGWFHTFMNNCYTTLKTHWDVNSDGEKLDHCLSNDVSQWNIKGMDNPKKPKYFVVSGVVYRSFRARVVALFHQELIDSGVLNFEAAEGSDTRQATVVKAIEKLTRQEYLQMIDNIYEKAFTSAAWQGNTKAPAPVTVAAVAAPARSSGPRTRTSSRTAANAANAAGTDAAGDIEMPDANVDSNKPTRPDNAYTTQARMLQEMVLFMTLRKAVRMQDIGQLRRAVSHLLIHFAGAGQNNYADQMAYLRWLLSPAADEVLQKVVLTSGTVNPSGKRGKAVAADEMLEMHNLEYSLDIKNSTGADNIAAVRKGALNRETAYLLRDMFETGIGHKGTSYHTYKNASNDVFNLADKLVTDGLSKWYVEKEGQEAALSDDILQRGVDGLKARIARFNQANKALKAGRFVAQPETLPDDDGPGDADERRENTNRGPLEDGIVDEDDDEMELLRMTQMRMNDDPGEEDEEEEEEDELGLPEGVPEELDEGADPRQIDPTSEHGW